MFRLHDLGFYWKEAIKFAFQMDFSIGRRNVQFAAYVVYVHRTHKTFC